MQFRDDAEVDLSEVEDRRALTPEEDGAILMDMTTAQMIQHPASLRPNTQTGLMPQRTVQAMTHHIRGRHTIRTDYDGPEAGLRAIDARDLDAATEAFSGLFGEGGATTPAGALDLATVLAYSRLLRMNEGGRFVEAQMVPALLQRDLDGSAHARAYMRTLEGLREVLAEDKAKAEEAAWQAAADAQVRFTAWDRGDHLR